MLRLDDRDASETLTNLYFYRTIDTENDAAVPLPNVSAKILSTVIEFSKFQVKAKKENESEAKIKEFNNEFV